MAKVIIIVNAEIPETGKIIRQSPMTEKMVNALKTAIANHSSNRVIVEVVAASSLWSKRKETENQDIIYCPLTIQLPPWLNFPGQAIFQACREIKNRREWVEKYLGYGVITGEHGLGDLWLPIILTRKGPLYGEVIEEGVMPNSYHQPVDLNDQLRQCLYHLGYQLLENLQAPPSVYLLQFSLREQQIFFDRLWPFPAAPSLASLNTQTPDLFTCYWQCLTHQSILDLIIVP
jgi:hypothetical protein